MARKSPKEQAPAVEPQEQADEPELTRASAGGDSSISQTDAVKGALDGGYELPGEATDYIRDHFGMEVSKAYFSAIKSKIKAQGGKSTKKRAVGRPTLASVKQAEAAGTTQTSSRQKAAGGETDLLKALEVMKPLIDSLGAEKVRRLVDLLD
jgi:hypothetical protein